MTNKRILIVDDAPLALRILERHLTLAGYSVVSARSGAEALNILCADPPSILITDWEMPDMTGLELCRAVRAHEGIGFVHVIILTAHSSEDRIVAAFDAGADDYLVKPFNKKELLARVRGGERVVALERDIARRTREVYCYNAEIEISNRKLAHANDALNRLATTDELTGLTNRRAAIARLEEQWAVSQRQGEPLSCMMIDIDHFKNVNDTHGHAIGDGVLRETASRLGDQSRHGDLVCRVGGEEFLIVCPSSTAEMAVVGAERLRRAIQAAPIRCDHAELPVTVSIGVAERTPAMLGPEGLLRAADEALYAAKRAGRNRVKCVDPLLPAIAPPGDGPEISQPPIRGGAPGIRERAVIVDPDPRRRAATTVVIESANIEVASAGNCVEAFDLLAQYPRDVLAIYLRHGDTETLEHVRRIKAAPATCDVPLILVADEADKDQPQAGLKAGAEEVVSASISPDELVLRIRGLARLHRALPQPQASDNSRMLALLLDFSRALAETDDLDAIMERTLSVAMELTGCRSVAMLLPDEELKVLRVDHSVGFQTDGAENLAIPINGSIAGRIFCDRDNLVANHGGQLDTSACEAERVLYAKPPLVICAMSASEHVVGVLVIGDRHDRRPFQTQEMGTINLISNLAAAVIHDIQVRRARDEARDSIVVALAKLSERRDDDTGRHLDRVTQFCLMLARELREQPEYQGEIDGAFIANLERAVPLHDIGKVAIPDAILLKPGKLNPAEMAIMRTHCTVGWETLHCVTQRVPGAKFLQMAENIAYAHHEWFDGRGYPRGLAGSAIPLAARIVALADVYDAITTRRVYKPAMPHDRAVSLIVKYSGTQFDPDIVRAFLRCEREFAERATKMAESQAGTAPGLGLDAAIPPPSGDAGPRALSSHPPAPRPLAAAPS